MVDPELSRRKILAGMAVTGTSGALVGSGTVSLFTDEETFTNNNLTGSTSIAGTVEIDVTVQSTESGIEFEISLPESDTENGNLTVDNGTGGTEEASYKNNPAYIWVRTLSCPDPVSAASEIDVKVSLKEDGDDKILDSGSVFDVFATEDGDDFDLNTGELLKLGGGNGCLEPGGTRTLVIDEIDGPDDTSAKIELEVYAEQCRYNSDPVNPFDSSETIDAEDCGVDAGKALSFISFCVKDEEDQDADVPDPEITKVKSRDDDGDPNWVEWKITNSVPVDYVVAKASNEFTMYDYTPDGATEGTVKTGGHQKSNVVVKQINPGQGGTPGQGGMNPASDPCQLAVEEFEDPDATFDGEHVKLEDDKDELEPS